MWQHTLWCTCSCRGWSWRSPEAPRLWTYSRRLTAHCVTSSSLGWSHHCGTSVVWQWPYQSGFHRRKKVTDHTALTSHGRWHTVVMAQIAVGCLQLFGDRRVVLSVLTTATFTGVFVTLVFALTRTCDVPVSITAAHPPEVASITYMEGRPPQEEPPIQQLLSMGCEPHLHKVRVIDILREMLNKTDERLDKHFSPSVLPVLRCNESLSYCGGNSGIDQGEVCRPANVTVKKFNVTYFSGGGERNSLPVEAEVHPKCICSLPWFRSCFAWASWLCQGRSAYLSFSGRPYLTLISFVAVWNNPHFKLRNRKGRKNVKIWRTKASLWKTCSW